MKSVFTSTILQLRLSTAILGMRVTSTDGTVNAGALPRKSPRKIFAERKSIRFTNNNIDNYEIEDDECEHEINDITEFDLAYQNMDPTKMWTLESSG
ncbi:15927_t:CDS:2, partial [Funneliformis mosseae]